ncbi:unnamed protein product [Mytilus coruscus]|uniref:Uncharacterized protein n=1 Tax=Mytilus coruscus TaxID=42192 RepID=A0A6J8CWG6_MYTCO|nr:unnamed protein product [Mytilus coruscus]
MFHSQLSNFMKGTNINAFKKLINHASSDFINRRFVMSAVDIRDDSYWKYERYGIIVHNELLQMYIQRVFSDMTQSEYVPVNRNSENKTFRENLNSYINALPEDKLASLIQTASSTCISRMHLVREEIFENANPAVFENEYIFVPKNEASKDEYTCTGDSPFTVSSYDGISQLTEWCLDNTANTNSYNNYNEHVLYKACINNRHNIVCRLLDQANKTDINAHVCNKTLYKACECAFKEIVLRLLEETIDVNGSYLCPATPLFIACKHGHVQIVYILLDQKADEIDINEGKRHRMYYEMMKTQLYIACKGGHIEIVSLLLRRLGIDVNMHTHNLETPLYAANEGGYKDIVSLLLKHDSQGINKARSDGATSLFVAFRKGHAKVVWLIRDSVSENVNLYLNELQKDCLSYLFFGSSPLHIGGAIGHIEIVKLLVNAASDINCLNETGCTPLLLACELGHDEIVNILFENRANMTLERKDGKSPISIARENGHIKITEMMENKNTS